MSAAVSTNQVKPGETAAVIAYMDTRRIPTPNTTKSVLVYVPFMAPVQEEVTLRVQTVARDDLMMSPDSLAFGTVKKGQEAKTSTKVTFLSDPNWQITDANSTGGYVKAEVKQDSRAGGLVTYEVTAILDKDCPAGNWVSDIYLKTSNPAIAKLRIPVTVNVTAPAVAASPNVVSFGNVALGTTPEKKVTLQSGSPFKILKVNGVDEPAEGRDREERCEPGSHDRAGGQSEGNGRLHSQGRDRHRQQGSAQDHRPSDGTGGEVERSMLIGDLRGPSDWKGLLRF